MIEALISGRLLGQPAEKMAKTGKPFVMAEVRVHAGEADVFVNVIAFSKPACAPLLVVDRVIALIRKRPIDNEN